jgi:hypothetical protein
MMLYKNEQVIDDNNYKALIGNGETVVVDGSLRMLSRKPRKEPYGAAGMPPFEESGIKLIPRNEWRDRIKEMERLKSRVSDTIKFPSLNQGQTNYCWINGVVHAVMITRAVQGLPYVALSPASAGAPIQNYRNEGGWGEEGVKYLVNHGVANQSLWPANAINSKYMTEAVKADYKNHRIEEVWDGKSNNFDQLASLCLQRIPGPLGLDWWGHLICFCDLVEIESGHFGCRIRNSWGENDGVKNDHGVGGFRVLSESRSRGDFQGIRSVTASPI